jgi:hypothetical protein
MKERPILYCAPMVRALLDGSKTQTRRVAKLTDAAHVKEPRGHRRWHPADPDASMACPYGQPGDRLWVRETFRGCRAYEVQGYPPKDWGNKPIWFDADGAPPGRPDQWASRSRPSIHMPRWASRITLEITSVRVERLQDISEADARAEGARNLDVASGRETLDPYSRQGSCVAHYKHIWQDINGPDSWDLNPWVWVIEFKRITS